MWCCLPLQRVHGKQPQGGRRSKWSTIDGVLTTLQSSQQGSGRGVSGAASSASACMQVGAQTHPCLLIQLPLLTWSIHVGIHQLMVLLLPLSQVTPHGAPPHDRAHGCRVVRLWRVGVACQQRLCSSGVWEASR